MERIEEFLGLKSGELTDMLVSIGIRLLITIVVLVLGFWLARILSKALKRVLERGKTELGLTTFLTSLTSIGLKVLVIITAITQLGVEMTSFVALLGAAGLAIGMAFSGTLSNFAGGVMILFFKPFKVGDYIAAAGVEGKVKEILIFNTVLNTVDNKVVILANGEVANSTIVNYTKEAKRRVDWVFGIGYGEQLKAAKELLARFIEDDPRILNDPEPFVGLGELGDSSVNLTVRAWVETDDYWDVFFDMNERVYNEFAEAGLSIPYPQMDIHIQKEA